MIYSLPFCQCFILRGFISTSECSASLHIFHPYMYVNYVNSIIACLWPDLTAVQSVHFFRIFQTCHTWLTLWYLDHIQIITQTRSFLSFHYSNQPTFILVSHTSDQCNCSVTEVCVLVSGGSYDLSFLFVFS